MKVSKATCVTLIGFIVSSLLLVFAANCSFEKQAEETSVEQHPTQDYYERPSESFVANPFCRACHLDFDQEELTFEHEMAGIGCERCHGESERHRSDEENITPPDIMYLRGKINPTCMMCHPRHEIRHVQDHQTILAGAETIFDQGTEDSAAEVADKKKCCTDCHGKQHRIKVRTVRWNKGTGELIKTE